MIDLEKEKLIGLKAATRLLPSSRLGRPVTPTCIQRWIEKGVKLPSGERVRLEGVRLGRRWLMGHANTKQIQTGRYALLRLGLGLRRVGATGRLLNFSWLASGVGKPDCGGSLPTSQSTNRSRNSL